MHDCPEPSWLRGGIVNAADLENGFLDLHGREVHAFSMEIANIGFNRMADLLLSMPGSEAWCSFNDGVGSYVFLPGEFDYFLSQQGIRLLPTSLFGDPAAAFREHCSGNA